MRPDGRSRGLRSVGAALALGIFLAGCESADPLVPEGTVIQMDAQPASIVFGSATEASSLIRATLYTSRGEPASVGVRFTTDVGLMESRGRLLRTDGRGRVEDRLMVTLDDAGKTAKVVLRAGTLSEEISVSIGAANEPPTANLSVAPTQARRGQLVEFNGSGSTDPNGNTTIALYRWTLASTPQADPVESFPAGCTAPGPPNTIVCSGAASSFRIFSHAFQTAQSVSVQLQVFDDRQAASSVAILPEPLIIAGNTAPIANAGADFPAVLNQEADFNAGTSRDPDGTIRRYDWNFGDGDVRVNETSPIPSKAYLTYASCPPTNTPTPGCAYTVLLTVYDNGDPTATGYSCDANNICTGTLSAGDEVKVTVNAPP